MLHASLFCLKMFLPLAHWLTSLSVYVAVTCTTQEVNISSTGASGSQVLDWDRSAWAPDLVVSGMQERNGLLSEM